MTTKINNSIRIKLLSGKPIPFHGAFIKQPTGEDIDNLINFDLFDWLTYPFCLTKEVIEIDDSLKKGHKLLDLIYMSDIINLNNKKENYFSLISILIDSFKFFFDTDNVKFFNRVEIKQTNEGYILENLEFLIASGLIINSDNFDELADIILLICAKRKLKLEKKKELQVEVGQSEQTLADFEEYMKLSQEAEEKEKSKLQDAFSIPFIINKIANMDRKNPDYNKAMKMTVWQLYNSYSASSYIENFEYLMDRANSGQFDMSKIKIKHWHEDLDSLFRRQD